MKRDPVCNMEVDEQTAVTAECEGERYYFCSEGCREKFLRERSCQMPRRSYDLIIISGGPAGLTAAVYASTLRMQAFLIAGDLGGQAIDSTKIENYMGYDFITGPQLPVDREVRGTVGPEQLYRSSHQRRREDRAGGERLLLHRFGPHAVFLPYRSPCHGHDVQKIECFRRGDGPPARLRRVHRHRDAAEHPAGEATCEVERPGLDHYRTGLLHVAARRLCSRGRDERVRQAHHYRVGRGCKGGARRAEVYPGTQEEGGRGFGRVRPESAPGASVLFGTAQAALGARTGAILQPFR